MPDNPNNRPIEIIVHSDEGFIAFARASGYAEDTINPPDDPLRFQSINEQSHGVTYLHIPMWRWEVDEEEFEKYPVTFV
jgi:hypothetical protein